MKFEDLTAWQESRHLVRMIFLLVSSEKLNQNFGLINQVQRSAVSIMSNIAEGFERISLKETNYFYNIARASCGETRSLIADNYSFLDENCKLVIDHSEYVGRLISGLIKSTSARMKY